MKKIIFFISFTLTSFLVFSDDENTGGIEEVIVTAERQASSIQDTALSITAFDENLIDSLNTIILKLIDLIMLSAPYGVFALLATLVVEAPSLELFAAL